MLGYLASGLVGVVIGLVQAQVIAFSLIAISVEQAFAIIFGIAFILLAAALGYRIWAAGTGLQGARRGAFLGFTTLIASAGIASLAVSSPHPGTKGAGAKVPLYAILGLALEFALTFSLVEFLNLSNYRWLPYSRTSHDFVLIGSTRQIALVFVCALLMGCSYGVLFGALDVEAAGSDALSTLQVYCLPVGIVLGSTAGIGNEYFRRGSAADAYTPVPDSSNQVL